MTAVPPLVETSLSLLDRVRENDQQAWERLCQLYAPWIYRWARRSGLGEEDATDVSQEVFISVTGSIHRFQHEENNSTFRGWLWMVTRNKVRDHFRKKNLSPGTGGSDAQHQLLNVPEKLPPQIEPAEQALMMRRVLDLLQTDFEQKTWKAFWRTAIDACPAAEVSDELGMSIGSVYVAKSRVLKRLRTEFGDLVEVDFPRG